jgi:2-C-methyl-D-erythritol 4-phosphate cytidylyltransferase/2-C-methyl-D-erythritol 2,4-cyclodiphosphate synthase
MQKNNLAIILSGGTGNRFNSPLPKQLHTINNKSIIELSVEKFINVKLFDSIIVVSHKDLIKKTAKLLPYKNIFFTKGGMTRQESVFNGLKKADKFKPKNIIIHDAVRPFFSEKLIKELLNNLKNHDGVIPSVNIYDSIRYDLKNNYKDVVRENLKLIQTPQAFKFKAIFEAHRKFKKNNFTDDSLILYKLKNNIKLIKGEPSNFKITTKEDLKFGELLIKGENYMQDIRVGSGFDVHKFKQGDHLIIFGVKLPFKKSLEGHSDADVGFHSIVDAILGALCMGDIGNHFPPNDIKWKNKPSIFFMKHAKDLLKKNNFIINNLDITLICEEPKVSRYKNKFIMSVSKALELNRKLINIKGTTTEQLGFLGRKEGIACQVSVTISKNGKK